MQISTPEQREEAKKKRAAFIAESCDKNALLKRLVENTPISYRFLFCEVFTAKNSKTKAIKAKCLDCSGFDRQEIKECVAKSCPLWNVRPYQK